MDAEIVSNLGNVSSIIAFEIFILYFQNIQAKLILIYSITRGIHLCVCVSSLNSKTKYLES